VPRRGSDAVGSTSSGGAAADMGEPVRELDLEAAGVTSIVWATGYRMDFGWILDAQFDEQGFPLHQGGITAEPGLYFVGLPSTDTRVRHMARWRINHSGDYAVQFAGACFEG
jgi:putative flavoprotein involved in K+ transport